MTARYIFVLYAVGDGNEIAQLQPEGDAEGMQSSGTAWDLGSLQQAGALRLAVMELEGRMDSLGKKVRGCQSALFSNLQDAPMKRVFGLYSTDCARVSFLQGPACCAVSSYFGHATGDRGRIAHRKI